MKNFTNKIPKNWKIIKFSEIAELRHGYQFRQYDFTEDGLKVFKITQIKGDGLTDLTSCSFIDKSRQQYFDRFVINKGDILIALTGATIGKIARFNEDEIVLQNYRVGNFFPLDENSLNKDFLYQFLKSNYFYNQIISNQTQSAQQNIGKEDINNMSVIFPPPQEQKSIAQILSTIDDKIENNLAINKTLEEMAKALYKHWFVDFGPFQEGEFVDSELGKIPKGWDVKQLDEIIIFKNQGVNTTTEKVKYSFEGFPVVRANNVNVNYIESNNFVFVDKKTFEKVRIQCKPDKGDVLFTNIGSQLGSACISYLNFEYIIAWNVMRIKVNDEIFSPELLTTFFNDKTNRIAISNLNSSSTMPFVSGTVLGKLKIIIPNKKDLVFLQNKFKSIYDKIAENHIENQTLTQLRDTLLPKLISGEVRLKEFRESITN